MLREMSFTQFLEWQAFDMISPIGDRRGDWQVASVCSAVMNAMAIQARVKKRFRTSDFLLTFGEEERQTPEPEPEPRQSWQEQKMIARMFAAMANTPEPTKKKRQRNG